MNETPHLTRRVRFLCLACVLWLTRPIRAIGHYTVYRDRVVGTHHLRFSYRDSLRVMRRMDELKLFPEKERLLAMELSRIDSPND